MKVLSTLLIAGLIIALLAWSMLSFQVRYDQIVIVEKLGRASEESVYNADDSPGDQGDGLYLRWPAPIERVYEYDKRIRTFDDRLGTQQTADAQAVVLQAYVSWRIDHPLHYHGRFKGDPTAAEQFLRARLRNARALLGNYSLAELTTSDASVFKLEEARRAIQEKLQADLDTAKDGGSGKDDYGIAIDHVGIKRLILPSSVTEKVHERMRNTRQRIAEEARSSGEAERTRILAEARNAEAKILDWARYQATVIINESEAKTLGLYDRFGENEELAVFRRKLEALRAMIDNATTIVLDTDWFPIDMLEYQQPDEDGEE